MLPTLLLLLLLLSVAAATEEQHAPTAAAATACTAATFSASNLSGFRLVGGAAHPHFEYSNDTTRTGCLAACCAHANCTAWNYHLSSADPSHNVRSCWLSTAAAPLVTLVSLDPDEPADADVWVGGSKRSVTCQEGGCTHRHHRMAEIQQCDGKDWTACRKGLWKYVFNTTTGELPTKAKPDWVTDLPDWEMKGFPGPGQGTGVGNVSWRMGLQKLVWEIGRPGGGMRPGLLRLNSTVWFARNTTGDAPSNSPPVPLEGVGKDDSPHCPDKSRPGFESWQGQGPDGKAGSDTLIIHHNGHGPCNGGEPQRHTDCTDCTPNFDTAQDWLNQLGYDVMVCAPQSLHGSTHAMRNACFTKTGSGQ
jgi:hypothetical protein